MAHFNPAVTLGLLVSGHITKFQILQYFAAEITGALLASLFVKSVIGIEASLGANSPDYSSYPLPLVFGVEVLASALLMAVIYLIVYTKGLWRLGGLAIGAIVGLD
jgi:aquaporin Z